MEDLGNVQPKYVPSELVNCSSNSSKITYNCYLIELEQDYKYEVSVNDIVLAMRSELDSEITDTTHVMCVDRGNLSVKHRHVGTIHLSPDQVRDCRRFQTTLFRILLIQDVNELTKNSDDFSLGDKPEIDYLLLPATAKHLRPSDSIIDWKSVYSFPFTSESTCECEDHAHNVWTIDDLVCSCKLKNCVVFTPHKPNIYIITGMMELNGNSRMRYNHDTTYKEYFKNKHGIELQSEHQSLLCGRKVFKVTNCLTKNTQQRKQKGRSMSSCELPPELCSVIMSPISMSTIYSFSFVPSIMHWLESLLLAFNLKKILSDHCTQDNEIPICKVLEAITAKECQVDYDYDSLETLGDSFLKYIVSQQLFKTYQNHKEGLLTEERMNIISNYALFKYGRSRKLQGFIRKEKFEPKQWEIPGDRSKGFMLEEELVSSTTKVYVGRKREMDFNVIADVVEALIGAFLSTKNEEAALSFLNWIGIKVDTNFVPYKRHLSIAPEKLVEVKLLESKLKYSFQDPSILVEALTHGSFKRPEIPSCYNYQRLEFLGDAVLDFLVTMHFYNECTVDKPSSQYLTEMRSDSVKNQFFAKSAIKANLQEHILCDSEVKKKIAAAVESLETYFCKVVADVIESIAGAIYVDSGYKKEAVFQSIAPLLELVTPETMKHDPFDELQKPSQKEHNSMKEPPASRNSTVASVTIEGKVDGIVYQNTGEAANKDTTQKIASDELLKLTKETNSKSRICLFFLLSVFFLFCWFVDEIIYNVLSK